MKREHNIKKIIRIVSLAAAAAAALGLTACSNGEKADGTITMQIWDTAQREGIQALADACRRKGMSICLDFIVNHTSDEHEWAVRARQGDPEYQGRYMCFDNWAVPSQFEKTVPQVFPRTAPGNFILCKQMGKHVLLTFNPYQWDMNYRNPVVFNEMAGNLLFLANLGVGIFCIDAVPYIWKQLGTTCRNLPQVHTIMRLLRILAKLVCPAVIFKGEVVMKPSEVAPYFGPVDRPECDVLYNVTMMVCIWNSLATRDVTLLKWQMETMNALPRQYTFVNYVRCHDGIGWGLDEDSVRYLGFDSLDANGDRQFSFYRNPSADLFLDESQISPALLEGAGVQHFCSVDLVDALVRGAHCRAVQLSKEAGAIVCFAPTSVCRSGAAPRTARKPSANFCRWPTS